MATISAAEVKNLRDATGAGMMDCKRALTEADGDFDKAIEILRVSGQAKAAKRGAERSATNGLVASVDGALLQLGAETDFVAKNQAFQSLAADAVKAVAASKADSVEAANAAVLGSGQTVQEAVDELAARPWFICTAEPLIFLRRSGCWSNTRGLTRLLLGAPPCRLRRCDRSTSAVTMFRPNSWRMNGGLQRRLRRRRASLSKLFPRSSKVA